MKSKIITPATLLLIFSTAFFLNSCTKKATDISFSFDKTFSGISFVLDTTSKTGAFSISQSVATGITQLATDKGFDISNIKSVVIKNCMISINDTSSSPISFNALDSASTTISAAGLSDFKIGSINPIPKVGHINLVFPGSGIDVQPYLKASAFSFIIAGSNNTPITHKLPISATITYTFSIN